MSKRRAAGAWRPSGAVQVVLLVGVLAVYAYLHRPAPPAPGGTTATLAIAHPHWVTSPAAWHLITPPRRGALTAWTDAVLTTTGHGNVFSLPPLPAPAAEMTETIRVGSTYQQMALWPTSGACQPQTAYVDWSRSTVRFCESLPKGKRLQVVYAPALNWVAAYCTHQPTAIAQQACLKRPIKPPVPPAP